MGEAAVGAGQTITKSQNQLPPPHPMCPLQTQQTTITPMPLGNGGFVGVRTNVPGLLNMSGGGDSGGGRKTPLSRIKFKSDENADAPRTWVLYALLKKGKIEYFGITEQKLNVRMRLHRTKVYLKKDFDDYIALGAGFTKEEAEAVETYLIEKYPSLAAQNRKASISKDLWPDYHGEATQWADNWFQRRGPL